MGTHTGAGNQIHAVRDLMQLGYARRDVVGCLQATDFDAALAMRRLLTEHTPEEPPHGNHQPHALTVSAGKKGEVAHGASE